MHEASRIAIAAIEQELAEMQAVEAAVAEGLAQRARCGAGPSVVYSLRLDHGEVAALERRAALLGLKPTVLARNLIREGLSGPGEDAADYRGSP